MQGAVVQDLKDIFFDVRDHTGIITLNRPPLLNALNLSMIRKLSRQLSEWETDVRIKQVMILSSSLKAFCAGGDLKSLYQVYQQQNKKVDTVKNILKEFFDEEYRLNTQIKYYKKPYTALLNGISMGGGLGLSIHGSVRIALNNLVLAMPETSIGYFTDAGATYFFSRLEGELGTYLALTGARLNASEALYTGLIHQIIGEAPQENHLLTHLALINNCFCYQTIEEILDALLKDNSAFAINTYNTLIKRSPTSLVLTLQILRNAKTLDFNACMEREHALALFFLTQHDFFEGIRATLIDKDKNPQWNPRKLSEVTLHDVNIS